MSTSNQRSTDEAQIRDLVESWARAVRTKNLDGIMANHSPEILMFDVPPPEQSKELKLTERRGMYSLLGFRTRGSLTSGS
jgi:ketosteroid isomerase-like protein